MHRRFLGPKLLICILGLVEHYFVLKCEFVTHFGSCLLKLNDVSTSQLDVTKASS